MKVDLIDKSVSVIVRKTQDEVNHHKEAMKLLPELEEYIRHVNSLSPNGKY